MFLARLPAQGRFCAISRNRSVLHCFGMLQPTTIRLSRRTASPSGFDRAAMWLALEGSRTCSSAMQVRLRRSQWLVSNAINHTKCIRCDRTVPFVVRDIWHSRHAPPRSPQALSNAAAAMAERQNQHYLSAGGARAFMRNHNVWLTFASSHADSTNTFRKGAVSDDLVWFPGLPPTLVVVPFGYLIGQIASRSFSQRLPLPCRHRSACVRRTLTCRGGVGVGLPR